MFIVAQLRSDRNLSHYHGQKQIGCIKKEKACLTEAKLIFQLSLIHIFFIQKILSVAVQTLIRANQFLLHPKIRKQNKTQKRHCSPVKLPVGTNFAWKPEACTWLRGVYLIWYFSDRSLNKPKLIQPLVKNTTTFLFFFMLTLYSGCGRSN